MAKRGRSFWGALGLGAAVGALFLLERMRPLRSRREPGAARVGRNLTIALLAAATTAASEMPLVWPVQRLAERRRSGLLRLLPMPGAMRGVLGFLMLDYTLYVWHRMNHRVPFLWRFHAVHHLDLDLDSTTGLRFHFGELALAAGFRALQILLLGVDADTLRLWQQLLVVSVVFHHSNLELPADAENRLVMAVATPRMHGIHHSTRPDELDSNFSSLLSWWDRLHGTMRLNVPQAAITTGLREFQSLEDVTLERSLALPFCDDGRLAHSLLHTEHGFGAGRRDFQQ
jgi:sterol desaturase/sphingolipid hydroxylase (fatty acid hydroxylase superfamily)